MNPKTQFIILGLVALSLIISLFFIHGAYTVFALVSIFIIACVMFLMPKHNLLQEDWR